MTIWHLWTDFLLWVGRRREGIQLKMRRIMMSQSDIWREDWRRKRNTSSCGDYYHVLDRKLYDWNLASSVEISGEFCRLDEFASFDFRQHWFSVGEIVFAPVNFARTRLSGCVRDAECQQILEMDETNHFWVWHTQFRGGEGIACHSNQSMIFIRDRA